MTAQRRAWSIVYHQETLGGATAGMSGAADLGLWTSGGARARMTLAVGHSLHGRERQSLITCLLCSQGQKPFRDVL